eukprot:TRINITY_DN30476_c0_g1_i1.p1 TRINITY_DN30476_c0_g1~~TRINITY_DN30476_c0_g1_i1.p1  ORF type:complete len:492 (+),score=129.46 TRINITY_DN30476_c0_g1_i1:56-1531(+)
MKRVSSRVSQQALAEQRRGCHDKWYGHLLELNPNYDHNDEDVHEAHTGRKRVPTEVASELRKLPRAEFMSLWEVDVTNRPRYWGDDKNPPVYDFWTPSELELRTSRQVVQDTVDRAQREIPASASEEDKNVLMNDIHEECLVEQDDKIQRARKVNWFAEANMMDILPDPLREKVRLDIMEDLHAYERQEIRGILREWIPEKYRLDNAPDMRKMALESQKHRLSFLDAIEKVAKKFEGEAASKGYADNLKALVDYHKRQVHPLPHITPETVKANGNITELEQWSRDVFAYNGDDIIFDIWNKAGEVRGNEQVKAFTAQLKSEFKDQVEDFNEEEREFFELFQKCIPLTEKEFLSKQMSENPVLEETLKHSSDVHILEEIEAFYNEHIEAEKKIVDALVSGGAASDIVDELRDLATISNAHYIGSRKYKTLAHELSLLADKHPEEYASFLEKITAMGNHHAQPNAPFAARVELGARLFNTLTEISDQLGYDEM